MHGKGTLDPLNCSSQIEICICIFVEQYIKEI